MIFNAFLRVLTFKVTFLVTFLLTFKVCRMEIQWFSMTFRSFSQTYQEFKVCRNGKFGLSSRIKRRFGSFCAHYICLLFVFVRNAMNQSHSIRLKATARGYPPKLRSLEWRFSSKPQDYTRRTVQILGQKPLKSHFCGS